ncbi:hypothetical protein AAC387_Pa07g0522 [Persea americana]
MAEEIVTRCALAVHGKLSIDYQGTKISLEQPWRRETMHNLVKEVTGIDFNEFGNDTEAAKVAAKEAVARTLGNGVDSDVIFFFETCPSVGHVVNEVFETTVEPTFMQPTCVLDYPIEISPLAKPHRRIYQTKGDVNSSYIITVKYHQDFLLSSIFSPTKASTS